MTGGKDADSFTSVTSPVSGMSVFHRSRTIGFVLRIGAIVLSLLAVSCASSEPPLPPWEGCRPASKIEYESAERDFLLQTNFGAYAVTGHWWRRYYWYCHI